jgi:phage baseplate assembly protein W
MYYKDISSYYGVVENVPLLSDDDSAILNGFINLVNTLKDSDGISERPFRPNLGSKLMQLLQDPIDDITSFQIKLELIALGSQMSRAVLLNAETLVTPNVSEECFEVQAVLRNNITGEKITGFFNLTQS